MKKEHIYSKFKFTNQIFYRKIERARVIQHETKFEVVVLPYFNYCGTFYIHDILKDKEGRVYYRTEHDVANLGKTDSDTVKVCGLNRDREFFFRFDNNDRKISIFDNQLVGIILKK